MLKNPQCGKKELAKISPEQCERLIASYSKRLCDKYAENNKSGRGQKSVFFYITVACKH